VRTRINLLIQLPSTTNANKKSGSERFKASKSRDSTARRLTSSRCSDDDDDDDDDDFVDGGAARCGRSSRASAGKSPACLDESVDNSGGRVSRDFRMDDTPSETARATRRLASQPLTCTYTHTTTTTTTTSTSTTTTTTTATTTTPHSPSPEHAHGHARTHTELHARLHNSASGSSAKRPQSPESLSGSAAAPKRARSRQSARLKAHEEASCVDRCDAHAHFVICPILLQFFFSDSCSHAFTWFVSRCVDD
jgi:hypothetical protein